MKKLWVCVGLLALSLIACQEEAVKTADHEDRKVTVHLQDKDIVDDGLEKYSDVLEGLKQVYVDQMQARIMDDYDAYYKTILYPRVSEIAYDLHETFSSKFKSVDVSEFSVEMKSIDMIETDVYAFEVLFSYETTAGEKREYLDKMVAKKFIAPEVDDFLIGHRGILDEKIILLSEDDDEKTYENDDLSLTCQGVSLIKKYGGSVIIMALDVNFKEESDLDTNHFMNKMTVTMADGRVFELLQNAYGIGLETGLNILAIPNDYLTYDEEIKSITYTFYKSKQDILIYDAKE